MSSVVDIKSETSSKWQKLFEKISFKKDTKQELNTAFVDKNIDSATTNKEAGGSTWINIVCCRVSHKIKAFNHRDKKNQQHTTALTEKSNALTTPHNNGILLPNEVSDQQEAGISSCGRTQDHLVPLRQILRYSMDSSDRQKFQRRRITQPFKPVYEIEWQKNQWLQLDGATNRKIERLRKSGFTKIAIRKDQTLKKHIVYDNPSEADVLLELSLHTTKNKREMMKLPEPIVCHQPSQFFVRRTHWWHASYQIGEAQLPGWVDRNACCNRNIMDAHSVMDSLARYSQSYLPSTHQPNSFLDTTSISQNSSVNEQVETCPSSLLAIKPLKYTEPPFLMSRPVLCAA